MRKLLAVPPIVAALIVVTASAAFAWHPVTDSSQECIGTTGNTAITWKVTNPNESWNTKPFVMVIKDDTNDVFTPGQSTSIGETITGHQTVDGTTARTVTDNVTVYWTDGHTSKEQQTKTLSIDIEGDCPTPPTTSTTLSVTTTTTVPVTTTTAAPPTTSTTIPATTTTTIPVTTTTTPQQTTTTTVPTVVTVPPGETPSTIIGPPSTAILIPPASTVPPKVTTTTTVATPQAGPLPKTGASHSGMTSAFAASIVLVGATLARLGRRRLM